MRALPGVVRLSLLAAVAGGVPVWLSGEALRQTPPGSLMSSSQTNQAPATGLILGQVVDAGSGQPVSGAIVTLGGGPVMLNGQSMSPDDPAIQEALLAARNAPRLMTGASGQFVFHDLRKGSYRVSATAPGYVPGNYGQHAVSGTGRSIDLDEGEHVGDATIKLWKYASITGRVVDEAGEPAVGITVRVLRAQSNAKRRALLPASQAQTDDRGIYRIATLIPADYVVAIPQTVTTVPTSVVDAYQSIIANGGITTDFVRQLSSSGAPMPGGGGMRVGDFQVEMSSSQFAVPIPASGDPAHVFVYQSVFYPTAPSSADASVLTLSSGQEQSGVDFQLRVIPTARVSGTINAPDGPARNMGVRLVPIAAQDVALDNGFETASTMTDANGAFTFLGVPAGQYTLKSQRIPRPQFQPGTTITVMSGGGVSGMSSMAPDTMTPAVPTDPTFYAQMPVAVGDRDVDGLAVLLRPGARVSGRLVFEGASTPPAAAALQRLTVSLSSADGNGLPMLGSANPTPARVGADGQFTTQGYAPGQYFINPGGAPMGSWTLKSVTLGGRNLDDDPIQLETEDVGGVVVTYSDQSTSISGTVHVTGATSSTDIDATVIAFPSNYTAWIDHGQTNRRQRTGTTGKSGGYTLSALPPGDYLVAAVPSERVGTTRDGKFYDMLARVASHVTLADGEKKALDLTLAQIR